MTDNSNLLAIRVRPDVQKALDKIIAVKVADYGKFTQTDAVSVALLAYAKTLPEVEVVSPKE